MEAITEQQLTQIDAEMSAISIDDVAALWYNEPDEPEDVAADSEYEDF